MTYLFVLLFSLNAFAGGVQIGGGGGGNATTATALAADPSDCAADTYATGIAASGNLTCATVTNAGLAGSIAYSKLNLTGAVLSADLAGSIASSKFADTMPKIVATINATNQTANIGTSTLYTVPSADHIYRATCNLQIVATASVSSTLGTCQIKYTDATTNTSGSGGTAIGSATNTGNTVLIANGGWRVFKAKASTDVQYSTQAYASNGSPAMAYDAIFLLERLD